MTGERARAVAKDDFWNLLAPHRHKLYNFIHKSLNFSVEADDVFQDTVLNAIRYFDSYRQDLDFGPWIFAIAHNEIRNHFRKAQRRPDAFDLDRIPAPEANASRELVREVYRVAGRLKPRAKEIFFLFYDSGFSIAEIADVTGMGQGVVKFQLHRIRKTLKRFLGA